MSSTRLPELGDQEVSGFLTKACIRNLLTRLPQQDHDTSILGIPNPVLRQLFLYLEAPAVIRKRPQEYLYEVFRGHDVSEPDPRDLHNLLRTCRTFYESPEDLARGNQLLSRFYINIPGPVEQEPSLVHQIGSGELQLFVVNPKRQLDHGPLVRRDYQDSRIDSRISIHPQQRSEHSDALVDMLSRQCLKWIATFIHWPFDNPEKPNDNSATNSDPMSNLRQNFLGVINFHQYDSSTKPRNNEGEGINSISGCRTRRFWAIICHCKRDAFLIIYNSRGTVWDRSFTCPIVAMVTST